MGSSSICVRSSIFPSYYANQFNSQKNTKEQKSSASVFKEGISVQIDVEECFQKYSPMVYRRCLQLLNVEALASDATQDVFVQLISNQERIENRAMISLLYRIATNVSLNIIRDRKTYDKRMEEFQSDYLLNKIAFNDQIEGSAIAENMLYRLFRRCPPSSKTIAVLYYYDGMTLEEVAEAMDMSVSGIRKRLRFLRGKLEELEGAIE